MKVVALSVKDFKGIRDAEIRPGPSLVVITGRNEQGKTSVLDALEAVLCGAKSTPTRPVRNGCDRAEVVADLGDLVVTRKWSPDGTDRLHLTDPDGSRPRAPQTLLESLFRRVTFDPAAFSRMEAKDQAKTLRSLAGLDAEFARIDAAIKEAEEERTRVNRDVKADEGAVRNYPPEAELADAPDEEVSAAELLELYRDAVDEKSQNDAIRSDVDRCRKAAEAARRVAYLAAERVKELRRQLETAEADSERARAALLEAMAEWEETGTMAQGLTDPDTSEIQARIKGVEAVNARVRLKRDRQAVFNRWVANREKAVDLTGTVESLRAEKQARLAEARYPVEGLDVRDDRVLWGGVPLDQVSAARKVRLGLAVGAALSPHLKVALVRDGSLLDDDAMESVRQWADETGFQVWVERVGTPDSPEGVIIEAGAVLADRQKRAQTAPEPDPTPTPDAAPPWRPDPEKVTRGLQEWRRPRNANDDTHDETVRDARDLF